MKRKGNFYIKKNSEIVEILRKSREQIFSTTVKDENQNAAKKFKYEAKMNEISDSLELIKLVDYRVENAIDIGFKIYKQKEFTDDSYSDSEKFGFLSILQKIQDWQYWNYKRIFNDKQLQCLLEKEIIKKEELKEAKYIVEKWNEYKLSKFPAKSRKAKCQDISNHYINRFKVAGLDNDLLLEKIKQCNVNDSISTNSTSTLVSQSFQRNFSSPLPSANQDSCRLCGKKNCRFVIDLNQKFRDTTLRKTVEYFCRVEISADYRLSQFICITCKNTLENFAIFANKIKLYQEELNDNLPSSTTINVKIEQEEYKETPITIEDNFLQEAYDTHINVAEDDTSFDNICSYSPILLESSKESLSVLSIHSNNNECDKISTRNFSTSLNNLNISSSSQISNALFESMENKSNNNSLKISNINMKITVKPCTVKLQRLPITYYPSDTESESEEIEDIFSSNFMRESSSKICSSSPKFSIEKEPSKEAEVESTTI